MEERHVLECPSCGYRDFEDRYEDLGTITEVLEGFEGENSLVVEWERSEDR